MNTKTTEIPRTTSSHVQELPSQGPLPPSLSTTTLSQILKSSPPATPTPAFTSNNYSYSNTFTMRRHDYSPLSSVEPNSRDMFSNYNNTSPPLFNDDPHPSHSDRNMAYHFSSVSSSPLIPTSVILPDEPSRSSSLYNIDNPVIGLEHSPTAIHPNFTPRHLGTGPSIMPQHLHHHNQYQHQHQQHHYHQTPLQQAPPPQPTNSYPSYPRNLLNGSDSLNTTPAMTANPTEAQLRSLQRKVRELEEELEKREKLRDMIGVLPLDWDERTRFREQKYCSLNRAGNALCAWHDSRRERRLHAPRMAPHRTLNCGCTYEEAIFEESLSRNGVGSFWPGESVRMDPMLRNRLLGLLQRVYYYKDGDFERNPDGTWKEGQSAAAWEERARRPVRRERS
ncbi:hypothetical protein Clacol_004484 [Clathrus columnatus]|uniref:Uncharacterized protein n=1 Tax=Clathrus columnatus TaxID=1419009 RepID=A0AAV5AC85_9AGAM|nr:hypothetical protein Clacol_004484 [Clathrus columnatus]